MPVESLDSEERSRGRWKRRVETEVMEEGQGGRGLIPIGFECTAQCTKFWKDSRHPNEVGSKGRAVERPGLEGGGLEGGSHFELLN